MGRIALALQQKIVYTLFIDRLAIQLLSPPPSIKVDSARPIWTGFFFCTAASLSTALATAALGLSARQIDAGGQSLNLRPALTVATEHGYNRGLRGENAVSPRPVKARLGRKEGTRQGSQRVGASLGCG